MAMSKLIPIILIALLLLISAGCASKQEVMKNNQINSWLAGRQAAQLPVEYRVPNMIDAPMMPAEVQKAAAAPGTAR